METATITTKQTISHYGFFGNDHNYGEHDPEYKQWVEKTHLIDWEDYECGSLMSDCEMLEDFCTENNKPFEFIFCEERDGFYKVDKKEDEENTKEVWSVDKGKWISTE